IAVVTWINVIGLRRGAILQNLATWAKFGAMAAFIILGFTIGKGDWHHFVAPAGTKLNLGLTPGQLVSAFGVALIAVFWAYDGWVYITWASGEVKDARRNVPRAMILGLLVVGLIYVTMTLADVYALPIGEIANHETIAHAAAAALFSPTAAIVQLDLVSLTTGDLCVDQRRVDAEYDGHAAYAGGGGDKHGASGCAGIFVLEAEESASSRSGVVDVRALYRESAPNHFLRAV